jgi:hypothetical protein
VRNSELTEITNRSKDLQTSPALNVNVCIRNGAEMEKEKINSKDEGGGAQRHKNFVIIALQIGSDCFKSSGVRCERYVE